MITLDVIGYPASGKTTFCSIFFESIKNSAFSGHVFSRDQALRHVQRKRPLGLLKGLINRMPGPVREPLVGLQGAAEYWRDFAVENPALMALVFEVLARPGCPPAFRECLINGFFRQGIQYASCCRILGRDDIVLWEEGLLHRGFTLLGYLPESVFIDQDISRYVSSIPSPNGVIWVHTPLEVVLSRLNRRKDLPVLLRQTPADSVEEMVEAGMSRIAALVTEARSAGIRVFEVDGDPHPENPDEKKTVFSEVQDWLSTFSSKPLT